MNSQTNTQSTAGERQAPTLPEGWQYQPPNRKTEYVGYDRRVFREGNTESGEAADVRASVWVREFPSVKVAHANLKSTQANGETFEYGEVKFDPSSVVLSNSGQTMKYEFGGSITPGPALDLLMEAQRRGAPVSVIIETQRRTKALDDKRRIGALESIIALRGGTPDKPGGNANDTKNNCNNVIVGVAPAGRPDMLVLTHETRTDPAEWEQLRRNARHDLPPSGWKVLDGGITRAGSNGATGVELDELAAALADRLGVAQATANTKGGPRRGHAHEAKPFDLMNSDGRVNPGSYAMARERALLAEAVELLTTAGCDQANMGAFLERAHQVKAILSWMGDQVQMRVTGKNTPDRMASSSKEAGFWIKFVYTTLAGYEPSLAEQDQTRAWATSAVTMAATLYAQAVGDLAGFLGENPADQSPLLAGKDPSGPAEQTQQIAASTPQQETKAESSPSPQTDGGDLRGRYLALLETVNLASSPADVNPLLDKTFGTHMLAQVNPARLHNSLTQWEADPLAFRQAAEAAWREQQTMQPA